MNEAVESVLEFWFGRDLDSNAELTERYHLWFSADADFDWRIAREFSALTIAAAHRRLDHLRSSARGLLALIVLLDQFPRNIYRGTAQAFAFDCMAQRLCAEGAARGFDKQLHPVQRSFFYLPLEHAESPSGQAESVARYAALRDSADANLKQFAQSNYDYAESHRRIIERFGRFPHRNVALGRRTSAEEAAYLTNNRNPFGQA